jgi:dienelactone hydrolase
MEVHLGKQFTLSASDSFKLGAYRADPAGTPKGGIVVIQEIFGVNQHIRKVCDDFAKEGYAAVAPALFDRTQKDFQSGYTPPEIEKGGAGPVRSHAEGFPVRLHTAGNREGPHLRRQA